jgi:hypothetical protein
MVGIQWNIEVDQNREQYAPGVVEEFIVQFIGSIYTDIEAEHEQMSKITSLHFNRIFKPRGDIGAYVRLRVFAEEADMPGIEEEIDSRLSATEAEGKTFQIQKSPHNWKDTGPDHGGPQLRFVFLDHLDAVSRTAYRLLCHKQQGVPAQMVENALWSWTHMFFNSVRGYGSPVIEFAPGAVTGFHPNV